MKFTQPESFALFDDATSLERMGVLLSDPVGSVTAFHDDDVGAALRAVEEACAQGLHAGGYCSYELGYVFEPRLRHLRPVSDTPLIHFKFFRQRAALQGRALARFLAERVTKSFDAAPFDAAVTREQYDDAVDRIRAYIGAGDVFQVNMTFKLKGVAPEDPFAAYLSLRESARAGACAFLHFGDEIILSFSPETFFTVGDGIICARPMKGTVARAGDTRADLIVRQQLRRDPKQLAENLMIVDLLRNDLSRVSETGSVEVSDLYTVETYPRFHTLTSGIQARLRPEARFAEIVRAVFPCGSVTGAPKIRAMEIIREVETEPRGVYCGTIGYVSGGEMAFNVAIRTMEIRDGTAQLGVGGGIVWDSEGQSEYEECWLKARFFTDGAQPFRLIETLRWARGNGFHLLDLHLDRLARSARYFGFRCHLDAVRAHLEQAIEGDASCLRVRLTLGLRGDTQVEVAGLELPGEDTRWIYALSERTVQSSDWSLHHKTTARALYDEEYARWQTAHGCDEVIFVNERGEVTEGSRSTVFLERGGEWLTPPLSCGVLDGCLRRGILSREGLRAREHVLTIQDLSTGQVWLGNSVRGLVRARAFVPEIAAAVTFG